MDTWVFLILHVSHGLMARFLKVPKSSCVKGLIPSWCSLGRLRKAGEKDSGEREAVDPKTHPFSFPFPPPPWCEYLHFIACSLLRCSAFLKLKTVRTTDQRLKPGAKNKSLCLLSCLSQVFCHRNRKLTYIHSHNIFGKSKLIPTKHFNLPETNVFQRVDSGPTALTLPVNLL